MLTHRVAFLSLQAANFPFKLHTADQRHAFWLAIDSACYFRLMPAHLCVTRLIFA